MQYLGTLMMASATFTAIALWWRAEGRLARWRDVAAVWELAATSWRESYAALRARNAEKQLTVFSPIHQAPRGLDDDA